MALPKANMAAKSRDRALAKVFFSKTVSAVIKKNSGNRQQEPNHKLKLFYIILS